jgi:hypothetical protein
MISTREEAELVFKKWLADSSTLFFAAFRPDRTVESSFYGTITAVSADVVVIAGQDSRAEVNLQDSQFAFVTDRDLPPEARANVNDKFDSGMFISQPDNSMCAFFEVREE